MAVEPMSKVEKLSVSLSEDLAEMVRDAVAAGGYTSSSEVIREALRDWKVKQAVQAAEIERLRDAWGQGVDDIDNGRSKLITTDEEAKALLDEMKKRGRQRLAAQRSK
jgi:antitoxin ParD1/3/4